MTKKKVVFSSQDEIKKIRPWVDELLKAIGHPEAWVSDLSCIGDFWLDATEEWKVIARVKKKLSIEVQGSDLIWEVARELYQRSIDETKNE